ncbi:MAG TPA: prepilin-type N-terminal cleavage/methylation domain-containing protein, partial [Elusimicrobiales bacterium]|nr:prepilin-type N-terminal cleavage/methylation domain-containing protein [Elusimicrobiales bacterium]
MNVTFRAKNSDLIKRRGVAAVWASERKKSVFSRLRAGITLIEVMVSLVILTVGIVALMGTFGNIQKAVQLSKNRTLAANLAQEKMQILKQK